MQLELINRNYEPSRRVETHVADRADKFTKYVQDLIQVKYTLVAEKHENLCEVHLHAMGKDFHSSSHHEDMLTAVDRASSSMEEQLRRSKAKRADKNARNLAPGTTSAAALEASLQPPESASDPEGEDQT